MAEQKQEVVVEGRPTRSLNEQPKREKYRLKAGLRHWHEGEMLSNEEEVELTKEQAVAFGDKFDKVGDEPEKRVGVTQPPDPSGDGDGSGAVGASHVPQDIGAETRDPKLPNINPGNDVPMAGAPSGQTVPAAPPARSAANTSAATGSPLSPPPTTRTDTSVQPEKIDPKNKPEEMKAAETGKPAETGSTSRPSPSVAGGAPVVGEKPQSEPGKPAAEPPKS